MTISPVTLNADPLQPLPSTTPAEQFLRLMEPRFLNPERLAKMIQAPRLKLYSEELKREPIEEVVRNMVARDIRIEPIDSASSEFRVSFSYPDRHKAQDA